MIFDPDDPRLSAYALGELDAAERADVQALLARDPAATRFVAELCDTAALLTEHLRGEAAPGLGPEHLDAIESKLTAPAPSPAGRLRWARYAAAACLLLALGGAALVYVAGRPDEPIQVAGKYAILATPKAPPPPAAEATPAPPAQRSAGAIQGYGRPAPGMMGGYAPGTAAGVSGYGGLSPAGPAPVAGARPAPRPESLARRLAEPGIQSGQQYGFDAAGAKPASPVGLGLGATSVQGQMQSVRDTQLYDSNALALGRSAALDREQAQAAGGEVAKPASGPDAAPVARQRVMQRFNKNRGEPPVTLLERGRPEDEALQREGAELKKKILSTADAAAGRLSGAEAKETVAERLPALNVPPPAPEPEPQPNTEAYDRIVDNPFVAATEEPQSTFSIDVDTASYANVRRFLNQGQRPPKDAVRIEEMVNYFTYDDPQPEGDVPFSINVEVAQCPWTPRNRLARIGLKGREIDPDRRAAANLVFLVDVSGSMSDENKLPLVRDGLRMLVERLGDDDRVGIVTYAGTTQVALPSRSCADKGPILRAIDALQPGGSTNGASGINLAYDQAARSFFKDGINRVILCTDGDFNVGITDRGALTRLIEAKAKTGVFLSVLGFGRGNLKDATMEQLADKGNGNYAYIDSYQEARKVLVDQMGGTLATIAKDVKVQVEFNPARVGRYRLIGYENRVMANRDFNDDTKDAGEIGAGHTVTALYELEPPGPAPKAPAAEPLRYQKPAEVTDEAKQNPETLMVKLRYKAPDGDNSDLIEQPVTDDGRGYERASDDFQFAAAVASFGMLLRGSPHAGNATFASVLELAGAAVGEDEAGYRREFLELVRRAQALPPGR